MKNKNLTTVLFLLLFTATQAQQLTLKDRANLQPIADAFFTYGTQHGVSDADGVIRFKHVGEDTLQFFHINFGTASLYGKDLAKALKEGVFYWQAKQHQLQPATVVALRPVSGSKVSGEIGFADQLTHDAGSYLEQLPGINSIRKSASYGFDPVLRGFKNERLTILIDGVQNAHEACPNRMDPPASQVAINNMSGVSILKGPYALRYGAAMGGIINFTSVQANFDANKRVSGRASTGYENNGNIIRTEAMTALSSSEYDFRIFAAYAQGEDYTDGEGMSIPADFNRFNIGSQLAFKVGKKQTFTVSANHNRSKDVEFVALPMDLRKDHTWLLKASHRYQIRGDLLQRWSSSVYATLVDHRMDNLLKPLDPRMMNAGVDAQTYSYGGRTESLWSLGQAMLYAGFDLKVQEAIGTRLREFLMGPMAGTTIEDNLWQNGRTTQSGFFAEWHLPKGQNLWTLSGRIDYNHGQILDPSDAFISLYQKTSVSHINPSFSAGFNHSFGQNFSTGIWVGRAQRSPGISERYINFLAIGVDPYEMLGNPELKPEANNQVDVLLKWSSPKTSMYLNGFASYMQDYISSVIRPDLSPIIPSSPGVRQFINIDKATLFGFEFSWQQNLPWEMQQQLSINYTYGEDWSLKEPLPEIAPMEIRYRILGRYFKQQLQPEASFRYAFAQERIASSYGETVTPEFFVIDFALAWHIKNAYFLRMGINNLLDTAYYEHLNRSVRDNTARPIYMPGRSFFLLFSANLQ